MQLSGDVPHPVCFYRPEETFERKLELLYEVSQSDRLLAPLQGLLKALQQFLTLHDWLTQRLKLTLTLREQPSLEVEIGAQQGEYKASAWQQLIALKLEQLDLPAPVLAIQLNSLENVPRHTEKADLFSEKKGALSQLQLVAQLQAKLGEQAVYGLNKHDDHRPEQASQTTPTLAGKSITHTPKAGNTGYPVRPFFLLPKPTVLTEHISIESPPERIQTGWWDNQPVERDYFIGRTHRGQWCWVFRTPDKQWFVHGIFS